MEQNRVQKESQVYIESQNMIKSDATDYRKG